MENMNHKKQDNTVYRKLFFTDNFIYHHVSRHVFKC